MRYGNKMRADHAAVALKSSPTPPSSSPARRELLQQAQMTGKLGEDLAWRLPPDKQSPQCFPPENRLEFDEGLHSTAFVIPNSENHGPSHQGGCLKECQ
jgi:hypothetical protein